ncbi:hypothetical protein BV898_15904 [Hypsibius exemplaris]|uniref:Receptor ligand binding region domain-containing protein n=1 Tax=Hypsibius exemplaris TaxID=2072580 RepID=A0A9X6NES2_HYPEX|nr:hypothetical protein BV898_15904 [Hypsibius exemplaris]
MPNVQVNRFVFDSRKVGMDYGELLPVLKDSGRVIFYLGHAQPLHKLLIAAAELNMTQGDYVFLAFIPFRHASFGNFGWAVPGNGSNSTSNDNEVLSLKMAFKCLLVIEPLLLRQGHEDDANLDGMKNRWMKQSRELDPTIYRPGETMSPHPMATYITMMAFAEVVEEIRQDMLTSSMMSLAEFGGRRMAAHFMNRTFRATEQTEPLTIDYAGERIIPMAVTQIDTKTGKVTIILVQDAVQLKLRSQEQVVWPSAWPVRDRPVCGFHGEAVECQTSEIRFRNVVIAAVVAALMVILWIIVVARRQVREHRLWWELDPDALLQQRTAPRRARSVFETVTAYFNPCGDPRLNASSFMSM